jgi:hypothetical protein
MVVTGVDLNHVRSLKPLLFGKPWSRGNWGANWNLAAFARQRDLPPASECASGVDGFR